MYISNNSDKRVAEKCCNQKKLNKVQIHRIATHIEKTDSVVELQGAHEHHHTAKKMSFRKCDINK